MCTSKKPIIATETLKERNLHAGRLPEIPGELVQNGNFDGDVQPWRTNFLDSTMSYSAIDSDGCSGSGSALATNNEPSAYSSVAFDQCVNDVNDAQLYDLRGSIYFPAADPVANAYLLIYWYTAADCNSDYITGDSTSWLTSNTSWGQWWDVLTTDITPASGAVSARVRLGIRRATDSDLNPISVYFDNVSLAPAGTIWILEMSHISAGIPTSSASRTPSTVLG